MELLLRIFQHPERNEFFPCMQLLIDILITRKLYYSFHSQLYLLVTLRQLNLSETFFLIITIYVKITNFRQSCTIKKNNFPYEINFIYKCRFVGYRYPIPVVYKQPLGLGLVVHVLFHEMKIQLLVCPKMINLSIKKMFQLLQKKTSENICQFRSR